MADTARGHIEQLPSGSFRVPAAAIPAQLDGLRKRERLPDLYRQAPQGCDLAS